MSGPGWEFCATKQATGKGAKRRIVKHFCLPPGVTTCTTIWVIVFYGRAEKKEAESEFRAALQINPQSVDCPQQSWNFFNRQAK